MNCCHVCTNVAIHSDAALCLTHSAAADRGEVIYDPDLGWRSITGAALPTRCDIEVSALREGS